MENGCGLIPSSNIPSKHQAKKNQKKNKKLNPIFNHISRKPWPLFPQKSGKNSTRSSPMLPLFIYPSNFNFNYRRQEGRTQPEMLNKKIESKPEQQISHL